MKLLNFIVIFYNICYYIICNRKENPSGKENKRKIKKRNKKNRR